jgi:hypothetical protein
MAILKRFNQPNSDLFFRFVHERGFRTAIFNLGVLGGINLAVPIGELAF